MEEKEFVAPEFKGDPKFMNVWANAYACMEALKTPERSIQNKFDCVKGCNQCNIEILKEINETENKVYDKCMELDKFLCSTEEVNESILPVLVASIKEILDNSEHIGDKSDKRDYHEFTEEDIQDILMEIKSYEKLVEEDYINNKDKQIECLKENIL